jgi:glycosyltransferase involved in cell wall biosynthesis
MEQTVSITIPAYNEEKRIGKTLEEYAKFFRDKKIAKEIKNFEILVVINNTKDKTEEVVKKYQKKYEEIIYLNFLEGGKGFAIIEGFKNALKRKNDLIGFVDADLATQPEKYYELIQNIKEADGAIASRWKKGAKNNYGLKRKIFSRGFNLATRLILFLPYRDTQCGAKIFKRKAIKSIIDNLGTTRWAFDIDLLYKLKKSDSKIKEVPTVWKDMEGSNINLSKVPLQMFLAIIRLRLLNSPFKFIVTVYNRFIPKLVKIHH